MKPKILFSICARGGSKGLPNKNISDFMGKPLIAITIEQALKSSFCDDIYISTDSKEIAKTSIDYGAKFIELRPKKLADDHCSKFEVWKYHLDYVEDYLKTSFDYFFDLDCTCPLRPKGDIDNMISSFVKYSEPNSSRPFEKY